TAVRRILRSFQKIVDEVDRVVEIIVVSLADVNVNLAGKLWPKLRPIAFEDVAEIVIVAPVLSDRMIDLSRQLVPNRLGITVAADRRENRLPDVPLSTG